MSSYATTSVLCQRLGIEVIDHPNGSSKSGQPRFLYAWKYVGRRYGFTVTYVSSNQGPRLQFSRRPLYPQGHQHAENPISLPALLREEIVPADVVYAEPGGKRYRRYHRSPRGSLLLASHAGRPVFNPHVWYMFVQERLHYRDCFYRYENIGFLKVLAPEDASEDRVRGWAQGQLALEDNFVGGVAVRFDVLRSDPPASIYRNDLARLPSHYQVFVERSNA